MCLFCVEWQGVGIESGQLVGHSESSWGSILPSECWSVPKDHGVSVVVVAQSSSILRSRVREGVEAMWIAKP